jgi:hypothetical protein
MVATIAYAVIAGFQLASLNRETEIMQGTLAEMKRSGEQSTKQMWSAIDNINWMARSMDWNQKVSKQGIESSEKQSKSTLQASIDQFHVDQRAWLGVSNWSFVINDKDPPSYHGMVLNSGKSAAVGVTSRFQYRDKPRNYELNIADIVYAPTFRPIRQGTVFPGQAFNISQSNTPVAPEAQKASFDDYVKKGLVPYVFGEISYRDVFNRQHWTHFCVFVQDNLKDSSNCPIYNDTDNDTAQAKPSDKKKQ